MTPPSAFSDVIRNGNLTSIDRYLPILEEMSHANHGRITVDVAAFTPRANLASENMLYQDSPTWVRWK
jgi:hypothetical protein